MMKISSLIVPLLLQSMGCLAVETPELCGVGIALVANDTTAGPKIYKIIPNSPAARAQLSEGLIVSKIDNMPVTGKGLKECVDLIRGAAGTAVRIEFTSPKDGGAVDVEMVREKLDLPK